MGKTENLRFASRAEAGVSAASHAQATHSRHVGFVTQQTCLRCPTANMPIHTAVMWAESNIRHVGCLTQQTFLVCRAADMSAASSLSRHCCCVAQQTRWLAHTANMSACVAQPRCVLCRSRHVCCVTQQQTFGLPWTAKVRKLGLATCCRWTSARRARIVHDLLVMRTRGEEAFNLAIIGNPKGTSSIILACCNPAKMVSWQCHIGPGP